MSTPPEPLGWCQAIPLLPCVEKTLEAGLGGEERKGKMAVGQYLRPTLQSPLVMVAPKLVMVAPTPWLLGVVYPLYTSSMVKSGPSVP